MIVTDALADTVESAALTAATVTVAGEGTALGAVYKPEGVIVPSVLLPPAMPPTCQVTDMFVLPPTVAVNCCECKIPMLAVVGLTVTVTGTATAMLAEPDFEASCVEVAMIVADPAAAGVNTPAVVTDPTLEGLTDHVTAVL